MVPGLHDWRPCVQNAVHIHVPRDEACYCMLSCQGRNRGSPVVGPSLDYRTFRLQHQQAASSDAGPARPAVPQPSPPSSTAGLTATCAERSGEASTAATAAAADASDATAAIAVEPAILASKKLAHREAGAFVPVYSRLYGQAVASQHCLTDFAKAAMEAETAVLAAAVPRATPVPRPAAAVVAARRPASPGGRQAFPASPPSNPTVASCGL